MLIARKVGHIVQGSKGSHWSRVRGQGSQCREFFWFRIWARSDNIKDGLHASIHTNHFTWHTNTDTGHWRLLWLETFTPCALIGRTQPMCSDWTHLPRCALIGRTHPGVLWLDVLTPVLLLWRRLWNHLTTRRAKAVVTDTIAIRPIRVPTTTSVLVPCSATPSVTTHTHGKAEMWMN